MKHSRYRRIWAAVVTALILTCGFPLASAQGRMHDKDIEATMKNLREDAKKFRSSFNFAVSKSTLRKTSQEKDAKALVQQFEKQTEAMLKQFKSKRKADQALSAVLSSSDQIDKVLSTASMGEATNNAWASVKAALKTLSQQFGVTTSKSR